MLTFHGKVLILAEPVETVKEESLCGYLYGISLMERGLFYPSLKVGHSVVSLKGKSIWEVTKIQLNVGVDKILGDWENRQIPRFRDNPPGPSVSSAVQELSRLSQNSFQSPTENSIYLLSNKKLKYSSKVHN